MADQNIRLFISAKDAASKVLHGVRGNVKGLAGSLGGLRNLGIAGAVIAAGVAIQRAIAAVKRWRDEYVAAMVAATAAEVKFQQQFKAAGKVDPRLQLRLDEAKIKALAGKAGENDTNKQQDVRRGVETDAALLAVKQKAEAEAQREKIAGLNDEAQGLLTVQSATDALIEKYKGAAGLAQVALDKAKALFALDKQGVELAGPPKNEQEAAQRKAIMQSALKRVRDAEAGVTAEIKKQTDEEKKRSEVVDQIAILRTKQGAEEENLQNILSAQKLEAKLAEQEADKKTAALTVADMREQAEGYRRDAEIRLRANKDINDALRSGSTRNIAPEKLRNMQEAGAAGGFESAIKSLDREEERKKRIRDAAVKRAKAAGESASPYQRRILAAAKAAEGAVGFANDAAKRDQEADKKERTVNAENQRLSRIYLEQIQKDLKSNLQGMR